MTEIKLKRKIYTVSELNEQVRECLEEKFSKVWLSGEISNLKEHSSGHWYFTLKDTKSQIRAAMFRGANRNLKFKLESGMKVLVSGYISLYTSRGDFQIIISSVEPAGRGELQLAFEQLKKKMASEGLFDNSRKKQLPEFPENIAVITSPTGAAIRDILNVTARRSLLANISIYPVKVQGTGAAQEIAQALKRLNAIGKWDVIICGRGGGSLEDLWAFNEEIVARAIADSEIPVISAVGHEIDYTIADFVSDVRAETPTAAAEMVVRDRRELLEQIQTGFKIINSQIKVKLKDIRVRLDNLLTARVLQQPHRVFEPLAQRLDDLTSELKNQILYRLNLTQERLQVKIGKLDALSPLKIMARGYSLVMRLSDKKIITQSKELSENEQIKIQFASGKAKCRIEEVL